MPRAARPKRRRRDYAAEYRRRQARAREAGFASYYQQRIRGGATASPEAEAPTGERLARLAGRRGRSAFLDYIEPGDTIMLGDHISRVTRTATGRYSLEKLVVPDDPERRPRRFRLTGLTRAGLAAMIEAELAAGAVLTPIPSLDQRRLL